MAARVGDCGGVGLVAWLPPMKHDPLSLSLSLSLSVCWGLAMDFGVWFISGFLILICWCGGGDFAMYFGF